MSQETGTRERVSNSRAREIAEKLRSGTPLKLVGVLAVTIASSFVARPAVGESADAVLIGFVLASCLVTDVSLLLSLTFPKLLKLMVIWLARKAMREDRLKSQHVATFVADLLRVLESRSSCDHSCDGCSARASPSVQEERGRRVA